MLCPNLFYSGTSDITFGDGGLYRIQFSTLYTCTKLAIVREPGASIGTNFGSKAHSDF